ncbi:MAG TPA: hypothetical protein PK095_21085, partial [Myxococcota bacterium]|nr:hypothetical protein [Myxococcota bacterium]
MSDALRILLLVAACGTLACRDDDPAETSAETSPDTTDTLDPGDLGDTVEPEVDTSPDTDGPNDLAEDTSDAEPEVIALSCGPLSPLDVDGTPACLGPASASCPAGT